MIAKNIFIAFAVALTIVISCSFIDASGCCFYGATGLCSQNADQSSCESNSGTYSSSPTCSSDNNCDKGCCALGGSVQYVTQRTCELLADTYGFSSATFTSGDASSCSALASSTSTDKGACLSGDYPPYDCLLLESSECSTGRFYNTTCTDPLLNTSCNATTTTICYDDDVYTQDTCGNPDVRTANCDYSSGTICDDSTGTAKCKSLNCEGHANGETWCVGNNYEGAVNVTYPDIQTGNGWSGFGNERSSPAVGSRYYTQYCIEGNVYTDPCADFRAETCSDGECKVNSWQQCISAGNDTESCDGEFCYMFAGQENIEETFAFLSEAEPPAGMSLLDIELHSGALPNEDITLPANYQTEYDEATGEFYNLGIDMCVPLIRGGIQFYPSESLSGANTGGTTTGTDGQSAGEEVCAAGNYETTITIKYDGDCLYLDASAASPAGGEYGNAAFLPTRPEMWRVSGTKVYGTQLNPFMYCEDANGIDGWVRVVTGAVYGIGWVLDLAGGYWGDILNGVVDIVEGWLPDWLVELFTHKVYHNVGIIPAIIHGDISEHQVPLNGPVVTTLIKRCKQISDCIFL